MRFLPKNPLWIILLVILAFFLCGFLLTNLHAQQRATTHSCTISWPAPADISNTTTYDVWRMNGPCPTQPGSLLIGWNRIAAGIVSLTYTDTNLNVGTYCWMVTQNQGIPPHTVRSFPSNLVGGTVTPTSLTIGAVAVTRKKS